MVAGQSVQTRLAQGLCQQIGARVFGGVPCVIQVTDTDYSWSCMCLAAGVASDQVAVEECAAADLLLEKKAVVVQSEHAGRFVFLFARRATLQQWRVMKRWSAGMLGVWAG